MDDGLSQKGMRACTASRNAVPMSLSCLAVPGLRRACCSCRRQERLRLLWRWRMTGWWTLTIYAIH